MSAARDALQRLRDGNRRFVAAIANPNAATSARHPTLIAEQHPYATILGCSDSRVAPEIVFGTGLGELFVIRVAGNVVAPIEIGSIEYAAAKLGTRLVLVLGHERCGAIQATIDELRHPGSTPSPNLRALVDRVRPSVTPLLASAAPDDPAALSRAAVRANVAAAVAQLRADSQILRELSERDDALIVGAVYSLETGTVEFLDEGTA